MYLPFLSLKVKTQLTGEHIPILPVHTLGFLIETHNSRRLLDGRYAAALATIAAMLRRVSVSDDDLAMAAAGCRALAYRYREDAKRQKNPMLVEASLARAEHAEKLAEHFDRERGRP